MNEEVKEELNKLNEIHDALAKAQSEIEMAETNKENSFFKSRYATLSDLIRASRKALTKNNLCVYQKPSIDKEKVISLLTVLGHSSGQKIEATMSYKPEKDGIQEIGKCITYLKRYGYASVCGVVIDDDLEDDGESEQDAFRKTEFITIAQRKKIEELLGKLAKEDEINMLKWAQVEKVEFISKSKFAGVLQALEAKIKHKGA